MKLNLEVPDTFDACGITILYDSTFMGMKIYSVSITRDEVSDDVPIVLPRKVARIDESDA